MATDREFMETLVESIDKRITDMNKNIIDRMDLMVKNTSEKYNDIKITVKDNVKDIGKIKNNQSKNSSIFGIISHTLQFIGLAILAYFQTGKN